MKRFHLGNMLMILGIGVYIGGSLDRLVGVVGLITVMLWAAYQWIQECK